MDHRADQPLGKPNTFDPSRRHQVVRRPLAASHWEPRRGMAVHVLEPGRRDGMARDHRPGGGRKLPLRREQPQGPLMPGRRPPGGGPGDEAPWAGGAENQVIRGGLGGPTRSEMTWCRTSFKPIAPHRVPNVMGAYRNARPIVPRVFNRRPEGPWTGTQGSGPPASRPQCPDRIHRIHRIEGKAITIMKIMSAR